MPQGVYPSIHSTSTSHDVYDQAFHPLSNFSCMYVTFLEIGLGNKANTYVYVVFLFLMGSGLIEYRRGTYAVQNPLIIDSLTRKQELRIIIITVTFWYLQH